MSGGAIGNQAHFSNADFVMSGGQVGDGVSVLYESRVTITGGAVGTWMSPGFDSVTNIAGGQIGERFIAGDGSEVNISGGTFAEHFAANGITQFSSPHGGSKINLFGTQFILGGSDITSTLMPNVPQTISLRDVWLTGTLADGSPFDFYLEDGSNWSLDIVDDTATLTVTLIAFMPGDYNRDNVVDSSDYIVWRKSQSTSVAVRGAGADGDFDGVVTDGDLAVWRAHFRQSGGVAGQSKAAAVVPEPGAFITIMIAVGCSRVLRRCHVTNRP